MEAIAKNVLEPFSLELVLKKVKNYPFSISTDACNEGNRKFIPVAVLFFDPHEGIFDYLLDFLLP